MAGDGRDATSDEEQQRRDSQSDEQQQRELAEILRVARIGSDWDVEDDSYVERAACTCTPQDQSKMAAWLPTLDEQVSFCVGDRAGGGVTNVSTFLESFDLVSHPMILGDGKFADIYRAYDQTRKTWVALKVISFPQVTNAIEVPPLQLKRELDLMSRVAHPNILALHGIAPLAFCARVVLVLEHARKDLYHRLGEVYRETERGVPEAEAVAYVHQVGRSAARVVRPCPPSPLTLYASSPFFASLAELAPSVLVRACGRSRPRSRTCTAKTSCIATSSPRTSCSPTRAMQS